MPAVTLKYILIEYFMLNNFSHLTLNTNFSLIMIFIIGSCIGSFLNVVIYRLPLMIKNEEYNLAIDFLEDTSPKITTKFNLSYPKSHCPKCKKSIPFWANIPILGYFITKMRCHYCHIHIPARYPCVEFITAGMFFTLGYIEANLLILTLGLIFISLLICIILISYDKNPIPNILTCILLWIGVLVNIKFNFAGSLILSIIGAVSGYIIIRLCCKILTTLNKNLKEENATAILAAALGSWFGYFAMLKIIIPATILFILYNLIFNKFKKLPLALFIGILGIIYLYYLNSQNIITLTF